jgi:hypothetical protein
MLNLGLLLLNSHAHSELGDMLGCTDASWLQALAVRWLRQAQAANNPEAAEILRKIYAQTPGLAGSDHDPWHVPDDPMLLKLEESDIRSRSSADRNNMPGLESEDEKENESVSSQTSLHDKLSLPHANLHVDSQAA